MDSLIRHSSSKITIAAVLLTLTLLRYFTYDACQHEIAQTETASRIVNHVITDYRSDVRRRFLNTVHAQLSALHPEVIKLVRLMLDPPSEHISKNSRKVMETPQSTYISNTVFNRQEKGFFIECGANDGERSSNTLWMEQNLHWTGLLIEADPYFYTQLLGKNRKSWSINACLSPYKYTSWLTFSESSFGTGAVLEGNSDKRRVGEKTNLPVRHVPCFPLVSLLAALNRSRVDYFSLDVEGSELSILRSIPHNKVHIHSWTIEYDKVGKDNLQHYMESQGYETVHRIEEVKDTYIKDLVFTKPMKPS